jgi:hypothetical protein
MSPRGVHDVVEHALGLLEVIRHRREENAVTAVAG